MLQEIAGWKRAGVAMTGSWLHEEASRGGVGEGIASWLLQARAGGKISGVVVKRGHLKSNFHWENYQPGSL